MDVHRELYASLVLENLWKEAVSSLFKITIESCDSYWINMSNILKCFCSTILYSSVGFKIKLSPCNCKYQAKFECIQTNIQRAYEY